MKNIIQKIICKLSIIVILCLSLFTITSCKEERPTINNVIAIGYIGDDIYLINSDNDSLLLEGYDLIQETIDDYMYFRKDGKYGFIDIMGKEIIEAKYDNAYAMKENKAVVVIDGIHHIIDNLGNIIFTLPANVTSSSYFSQNRLVITKDNKYDFLTYNEVNSSFTLPSEFKYDYALPYSEGYSVVGLESAVITEPGAPTSVSVKYNYLGLNNILLFEEYKFDEAEPFDQGFAKVGIFTKDVQITGHNTTNSQNYTRYFDLVVYKYLKTDGTYFTDKNHNVLEFHYGSKLSDGIFNTAKLTFLYTDLFEVNLYKKYTFYTLDGFVAYENGFRGAGTSNVNVFWPTNLISLGDCHVFAYGKQSISWNIAIANEEVDGFKSIYPTIDVKADWVSDLATTYHTTNMYIANVLRYPYHISDLKIPEYSNDKRPILVTQLSFNDNGKYGIIQINYDQAAYEASDKNAQNIDIYYSASYIVAPIYDRIVI